MPSAKAALLLLPSLRLLEAEPHRSPCRAFPGGCGVSPCFSGSSKAASASREPQQPRGAAAVAGGTARGAVLRGEGRTPGSARGHGAGGRRGSGPRSCLRRGRLGPCCHRVCQVAVWLRGVATGLGLCPGPAKVG